MAGRDRQGGHQASVNPARLTCGIMAPDRAGIARGHDLR